MTFVRTLAVGTFLASTLAATGALAKAHEQGIGKNGTFTETAALPGDDSVPGRNVEATVAGAPGAQNRAGSPDPMGRPDGVGNVPNPPAHGYGHDNE